MQIPRFPISSQDRHEAIVEHLVERPGALGMLLPEMLGIIGKLCIVNGYH